jgi:hypothetical protein
VAINPTRDLDLPAKRGGQDRIAPPEEAAALIAALPAAQRALWSTAFYAGLRRGELCADGEEVRTTPRTTDRPSQAVSSVPQPSEGS